MQSHQIVTWLGHLWTRRRGPLRVFPRSGPNQPAVHRRHGRRPGSRGSLPPLPHTGLALGVTKPRADRPRYSRGEALGWGGRLKTCPKGKRGGTPQSLSRPGAPYPTSPLALTPRVPTGPCSVQVSRGGDRPRSAARFHSPAGRQASSSQASGGAMARPPPPARGRRDRPPRRAHGPSPSRGTCPRAGPPPAAVPSPRSLSPFPGPWRTPLLWAGTPSCPSTLLPCCKRGGRRLPTSETCSKMSVYR